MKTRIILLSVTTAALATINATAGDALLSPRAQDNQIRSVPAIAADTATVTAQSYIMPRVTENRRAPRPENRPETNPAMLCSRNMVASPKAITACAEHPGAPMPCCGIASSK